MYRMPISIGLPFPITLPEVEDMIPIIAVDQIIAVVCKESFGEEVSGFTDLELRFAQVNGVAAICALWDKWGPYVSPVNPYQFHPAGETKFVSGTNAAFDIVSVEGGRQIVRSIDRLHLRPEMYDYLRATTGASMTLFGSIDEIMYAFIDGMKRTHMAQLFEEAPLKQTFGGAGPPLSTIQN